MNEAYINEHDSIFTACGGSVGEALTTVTNRYIGNHPQHPMTCRAFNADGILKKHDYSYDFNLTERFPDMRNGQYIYAWSKFWSEQDAPMTFILHCYGPLQFFANGASVYKANLADELNAKRRIPVTVPLNKGWNHFVILFTKTEAGCGGSFGPGSYKSNPTYVLAPSPERNGHEGWIYSGPQDKRRELPG
ncbi:hypothetical protein K0U00_14985, partial [Paenibacillus sepulcri]|nr:hypothetical protein [Paenibacillus sepulcri]